MAHRLAARIAVCIGVMFGLSSNVLAQKPILKGGVEQSDIRKLPDGTDPYLTDGKCMATCGAAKEWLKTQYSQAERQATSRCLALLDSAHEHEETFIDLQKQADAAAAAHEYKRRDELLKQVQPENVLRSKDLRAFGDCLKQAHVDNRKAKDTPPASQDGGGAEAPGPGGQDPGGLPPPARGGGSGSPSRGGRPGGGTPGTGGPGTPTRPPSGGTGSPTNPAAPPVGGPGAPTIPEHPPAGAGTPGLGGPPSPSDSAFANQLLGNAQTILQNAGRISKAMTDAMDVTKHNNVGVGVAVGSYFGASAKLLGVVAQQYKLLAAAGSAVAAAEKTPIQQIANEAASQSARLAGQAEEAAAEIAKTGRAAAGPPMGTAATGAGYLEGIQMETAVPSLPPQGSLPTCGVLSCARVAELLGKNVDLMRVIDRIRPRVWPTSTGDAAGGLTAQEIEAGLKSIGINAQVGSDMTAMMNQVRNGNPVIAGVYTTASGTSPLHAIVIEGIESRAGVNGLKIYDPTGWFYWQPIQTFQKYFTNQFVMPL